MLEVRHPALDVQLFSVAVTRDDCVVWQIIFYLILVLRAMFLSINSLG